MQLEDIYQFFQNPTPTYDALKFLESEKAIASYWQKVIGRGRPRQMYQVSANWQAQAALLARLWQEFSGAGS